MEKTIAILNRMVGDGVIPGYVIGGATGLMFYTEPLKTVDLDIFVLFPETSDLLALIPIYEYLRSAGGEVSGEYVVVAGIPVQIIPVGDALVREAYDNAHDLQVGSEPVRVMRVEHLIAIMIQLARPKDKARLSLVLDQAEMDNEYFGRILIRNSLAEKWLQLRGQLGI